MAAAAFLVGCSSSRHVPAGEYLLDKVKLNISDSTGTLGSEEMINYVRQLPNHKILWSMKLQLGVYNMSGRDTTKWWNRWIRKIGEAPVIYDSTLMEAGVAQLEKAMINKGFLHAQAWADTIRDSRKRKMTVVYNLKAGNPHKISSISYDFPSDTIDGLLAGHSVLDAVRSGDLLDRSRLEDLRNAITARMRNNGYYDFSKEYVTFVADTTGGSRDVDLTVRVSNPGYATPDTTDDGTHRRSLIRNIWFVTDYDPSAQNQGAMRKDTVEYKDINVVYGERRYLRPSVLYDNCWFRKGEPFRQIDSDRTYESLNRLNILKFINIYFRPSGGLPDGTRLLDVFIMLTPGKSQSVAFELEGTNSEGDLGIAASVTYSHRNIGKGSETLTAKIRGAYEAIGGRLEGFIHNRYMEYSVDLGVNFPKFKFPLLRESFKRRIKASTEFNVSMNYQERPEYTRIIATAGWQYLWTERSGRNRHTFTPIDINYVYLPESTYDFIDQIAPDNPLLRYSYEDHFIMRMGYSFYHTNKRRQMPGERSFQPNIYTLRVKAEIAGNLLFLINSIFNHRSNFHEDPYKIFGIRYSQYVKAETDYAITHIFDQRNSIAFHAGFGIGVPYGNSSILPFEKRFYGGGANGVRGWDVRTLGPGSYDGSNSVSDFINQCGDIRLDLNLEYRAKLFWVVELAAFIDAGNIWTIHNYQTQPGGMFHFNSFYKELAASYGLGIRLDFDYFLLRFDMGMKAHNPAANSDHWPLIHPRWGRDSSFHFSIGYPF